MHALVMYDTVIEYASTVNRTLVLDVSHSHLLNWSMQFSSVYSWVGTYLFCSTVPTPTSFLECCSACSVHAKLLLIIRIVQCQQHLDAFSLTSSVLLSGLHVNLNVASQR